MKIAFVANTCWNIYNFRRGLVHYFLQQGDEVVVLAPRDEYTDLILEWGVKFIDTPLEGTGTNPFKDFLYFRQLRNAIGHERPVAILSFTVKSNIYASLVGRISAVPVICNVSGLGTVFLVKGLAGVVALLLYRLAFRFSSHVFFQNRDDQELFTKHVPVSKQKMSILPGSGIDTQAFTFQDYRNNDKIKFLMIGRVIVEKGVREYVEAAVSFKDDPNVSFTLIGRLDESHSRSITQKEVDGWVANGWIDYLDHSDNIKEYIADHDAVVLPSYREGTSRTLLEGGAMGRPLITTDVPGCREVVEDGYNGFLCKPKNVKSLEDKIRLFMSLSYEERNQLAKNSRKLVEDKFNEKRVIDAYDTIIRRNMA